MQETLVRSLGLGRSTHYRTLAWRIPWTVPSLGSQRVGHVGATFTLHYLRTWVSFNSFEPCVCDLFPELQNPVIDGVWCGLWKQVPQRGAVLRWDVWRPLGQFALSQTGGVTGFQWVERQVPRRFTPLFQMSQENDSLVERKKRERKEGERERKGNRKEEKKEPPYVWHTTNKNLKSKLVTVNVGRKTTKIFCFILLHLLMN